MASRIREFPVAREFPEPREIPVTREFPRLKHFPPVSRETGISREFPARGFPLNITVTNAPAMFQRIMNLTFSDMLHKCVCVYLDDILVFSETEQQHLHNLRAVL